MKFRVIRQPAPSGAHSPIHVIEQETGQDVGWINRYLDREYVRRLADKSLYSYAHSLLHFVRWWERRSSHRRHLRGRPYRINLARLHPLPVQPATAALCLHHQRSRGLCRSRYP